MPTGFLRTSEGPVVFDPDVSVRDRIRLVFDKFLELGTVQKVLYYTRAQLKLPRRQTSGVFAGEVLWKEPSAGTSTRF